MMIKNRFVHAIKIFPLAFWLLLAYDIDSANFESRIVVEPFWKRVDYTFELVPGPAPSKKEWIDIKGKDFAGMNLVWAMNHNPFELQLGGRFAMGLNANKCATKSTLNANAFAPGEFDRFTGSPGELKGGSLVEASCRLKLNYFTFLNGKLTISPILGLTAGENRFGTAYFTDTMNTPPQAPNPQAIGVRYYYPSLGMEWNYSFSKMNLSLELSAYREEAKVNLGGSADTFSNTNIFYERYETLNTGFKVSSKLFYHFNENLKAFFSCNATWGSGKKFIGGWAYQGAPVGTLPPAYASSIKKEIEFSMGIELNF